MQQADGLDVAWLDAAEAAATAVTLSPDGHRGGSFAAADGAIDPPRNVRAYSLAMQAAGVELRERTAFTGLRTAPTRDGGTRVVAVETDAGVIETERVLLTGGPSLRAVGRLAGVRIPAGAARHTVAVLEPHPAFAVETMPMVFDIGEGLYWRLEEGGLLFGWSDPDEIPGEARSIDWAFYETMRARLAGLVPVTRDLACARSGRRPSTTRRTTCRSSGPALRRRRHADRGRDGRLAGRPRDDVGPGRRPGRGRPRVRGTTDLIDVSELGLDRFDAAGRSRLATDPDRAAVPDQRRRRRGRGAAA